MQFSNWVWHLEKGTIPPVNYPQASIQVFIINIIICYDF